MHKGINTTADEGQTPIIEIPEVMCTLRSSGAGFDRPGNASTEHETYLPVVHSNVAPTLTASNDPSRSPQSSEITKQVEAVLAASMAVRRLTPRECERLQGFPDDYTDIPWRGQPHSPDGPRYRALGNSMAVPVMNWIGKRINQVEKILDERREKAPQ
jgi:site-specific DNA-cytosine methylase